MTNRKRTNGAGTIYSTNPADFIDGKPKAKQVGPFEGYLRHNLGGGKRKKSPKQTGATRREVEHKLDQWAKHVGFEALLAEPEPVEVVIEAPKSLLGPYIASWFTTRSQNWRKTTLKTNTSTFTRYLTDPFLCNLDMQTMTKHDIKAYFNQLPDSVKASKSTANRIFRLLDSAMADALDDDLLIANPCARKMKPKVAPSRIQFFRPDQEQRLLAYVMRPGADPFWKAAVLVGLDAGLRTQELLGLQRECIDWLGGKIHIEWTLDDLPGGPVLKPFTKTDSSFRTIDLAKPTMDALRGLLGHTGDQSTYVFANEGKGFDASTYRRRWKVLMKEAGLPSDFTPYATRHTMATRLLSGGAFLTAVSRRLGHAAATTTLRVYSHAIPQDQFALVQAFEKTLTSASQSRLGPVCGPESGPGAESIAA